MKLNLNLLLWVIGIILVIVNEFWVFSVTTYQYPTTSGKFFLIAADLLGGVLVSAFLTLLFSFILAVIPFGHKTYKKRVKLMLPVVLILTELFGMYVVHKRF